ncbi:phospholipase D-like domain-containing protein [Haloarcula laminariae]|uniref:phospholipase D-like domain-containing protein n=1 Tax=Haloarcula laminariae TaxID=2961577 RepID=UPI0021C9A9E3|nr:phospholipase D-like domain-containing protein [Halomicroarcula laminariae]
MTENNIIDTARALRTRSPERLWGVSPESIYAALSASVTKDGLEERLSPHIRAETLRTNDEREPKQVTEIHNWILDELDLIEGGRPTLAGALVLSVDEPRPLIQAIIVASSRTAERVLRSSLGIEDEVLPRREFDSLLAGDWEETILGPLLGSAGFVTIYPDSVEPNFERIEPVLEAQREVPTEAAIAESYLHVLPQLSGIEDGDCLKAITERLVGELSNDSFSLESVAASLADNAVLLHDTSEVEDAIEEQHDEYERQFETVHSLLAAPVETELSQVDVGRRVSVSDVRGDTEISEAGRDVLTNIIATISAHLRFSTFDLGFVTDRLDATPYELYQVLSEVPGVDCEISGNEVIEFATVPAQVDGSSLQEEYTTHLIDRCAAVKRRIKVLSRASVTTLSPIATDAIIAQDYDSLSDGDVAPAYFTFTLVDPDALGEKKMDDYVEDSRGLGRERARLRRWHENRPAGMRSYTAMTDRLFSLGLERDLDDKVLRIMTPFDDDTFNEYVSQIRRLLQQGFELRLLTRHTKEPWEWRRLQQNLLSEIKQHREQVTIRSYSRFKQHQRVTPDMDFRDLGEFGIHGKVQTIGRPEEGAALLGSANFMENSYDWNPECGVYTERIQFVDAAVEFFDIVWDLAESDELSTERLQEVPNHQLVPTYYS